MTRELLHGLTSFKKDHFGAFENDYRKLVTEGQKPGTLFIGCSDSRVVPSMITGSRPGDLFVVRNMGNIVPRFEADGGYDGVSAAIDYGVDVLEVRDIVICGHSHCGAVRALYEQPTGMSKNLCKWLELAAPAKSDGPVSEEMLRRTEQRSVIVQLKRLMTYPSVRARVESGRIVLHGWHYMIEEGTMYILDVESEEFVLHT